MDKKDFLVVLQCALLRFEGMSDSLIYHHVSELYPKPLGKYILLGIKFADYVQRMEKEHRSIKNGS